MPKFDTNRVTYYPRQDLAWGRELSKGEKILIKQTKSSYEDINDILELYNISKYLTNGQYLNSWSQEDITVFLEKGKYFGKMVGSFFSKVTDSNLEALYDQLIGNYTTTFWEIVNNQKVYKKIAAGTFASILEQNRTQLRLVLKFKELVAHYKVPLRTFFLSNPHSAEILLTHYEVNDGKVVRGEIYLPPNLTIDDKETIVSNYVAGEKSNLNYLRLIRYSKNQKDFKISDKTKLRAKRKEKIESDTLFDISENASVQRYGVGISFSESQTEPVDCSLNGLDINYSYSVNYIRDNCNERALFVNFATLFNFTDEHGRINLVNKKSQRSVIESIMGITSVSEYPSGISFQFSEMTSHAQMVSYGQVLRNLDMPLENVLKFNFVKNFKEQYGFAENAELLMPSSKLSFFEKVVLLAPQFERVLKQYKLFVEEGEIDFELLQISSSPSSIKDIPSLIDKKYFYINSSNDSILGCSNLLFSDQFSLAYVEPFIEKKYNNFFDLLSIENFKLDIYEEWQRPEINYLMEHGLIFIDDNNFIQIKNYERLYILKDLWENEVAVFANYHEIYQREALQMERENLIKFESSLFSKPEQSYFNYYLNKSEFTNGFDLRNSYIHGTQPNPEEVKIHQQAYFSYLKLLVLALLKIDNDLFLAKLKKFSS